MTEKKPATPLTPAQLELVQSLIADRHERIVTEVNNMISGQVTSLREELKPQIDESIKYGERVALRAASGKLVGANEGGPTVDGEPFEFVAKSHVAAHESFTTERGQG